LLGLKRFPDAGLLGLAPGVELVQPTSATAASAATLKRLVTALAPESDSLSS
jgi:hypothetical protein